MFLTLSSLAPPQLKIAQRETPLDILRGTIVLLVFFFHSARLFDRDPWHFKLTTQARAADIFIFVMNIFAMPLLFLMAGLTLYYSLAANGGRATLKARMQRLLLPLVFGLLVLIPPQVYIERITPSSRNLTPFLGDFWSFYPSFFTCCYPTQNLSWHHLWFIFYLFMFSVFWMAVYFILKGRQWPQSLTAHLAKPLSHFLFCVSILFLVEYFLRASYPTKHNFISDHANTLHYGFLVGYGLLLAQCTVVLLKIIAKYRAFLTLAFSCLVLLLLRQFAGLGLPQTVSLLLREMAEIALCFGLIGLFSAVFKGAHPRLSLGAALSYWAYIFHQSVIIILAFFLAPLHFSSGVAFTLIVCLSLCLSFGLAYGVRLVLRG